MRTIREMADLLHCTKSSYLPDTLSDLSPSMFCFDSRTVQIGSIFVCIKGERVDGHDFAAQVVDKGGIGLLAERDPFPEGLSPVPVLRVDNTVRALNDLALLRRQHTQATVVGITGTAGKTSLKEVLAGVLSRKGVTGRNPMNLNSQIGLPVSILNISDEAVFWVLEAGINQAHDMDELGEVLRPDLAIILNAGAGHVSGLGDRGVAYYKSRLLAHLSPGGQAVVSADYPDLVRESSAYDCKITTFSYLSPDADCYAKYLGGEGMSTGLYEVRYKNESKKMTAPFRGEYGAENVAAIVAAASLLGLDFEDIEAGLSGAPMPPQRFSCRTVNKFTIIDDSYNANPLSTRRMIDSAVELAREKQMPLVLVMGEMLELGNDAGFEHEMLGRHISRADALGVFWKGGEGSQVCKGLASDKLFQPVTDANDFLFRMREFIQQNDLAETGAVFLFKGSRGSRIDPLVQAFCLELGGNNCTGI